ncbi:MAG TPA: hypothetical protein VMI32_23030 [Candidatus Solibacter sp.]|nr:hypothetical protein [Candidatus Solibacter sp.]
MGDKCTRLGWIIGCGETGVLPFPCLAIACLCLMVVTTAAAQVATAVHDSDSGVRLLNIEEGRSIVHLAWQQERAETRARDCSHLVHEIYVHAGFEYPYASSFEIYAGNRNFTRVKYPHTGDLIAWPGHVGIVVDPLQHSFYSLVRTGLEEQDYQSAYWRSRGRPRFYRYKVETGGVVRTASVADSSGVSNAQTARSLKTPTEERSTMAGVSSRQPAITSPVKTETMYNQAVRRGSEASNDTAPAFEIPASLLIATGNRAPTREEVAEGISGANEAMGVALQGENPFQNRTPLEIVQQFKVEKVSVKHDHGWARVAVDSKVLIDGGVVRVKHRHEKVRWELRRTGSGCEAVTPMDRTYVSNDGAVKILAANLAQLANSDGAAQHQQIVLQQESQLAGILNALLENKQDR